MKLAICLTLGLLCISGCSGPFEDMSDEDLADAVYECRTSSDQSPAYAIRCDNYKRECENRRDQGRYVC